MGNDVVSWRVSVGLFCVRIRCCWGRMTTRFNVLFEFAQLLLSIRECLLIHSNTFCFCTLCSFSNIHYVYVIAILLLVCGDVEKNPGPDTPVSSGELSLLHLNVRSIRNKIDYIFDNLADHDILCFTETHLDNQVSDSHLLNETSDFKLYRRDFTAHSSGIAVYVSNGLYSHRRLDLESPSIQSTWVEITFHSIKVLLCTAYRPPDSRVSFWEEFNVNIENALDVNPNIIIVGDLNENLFNNNLVNLKNILLINNLRNVINEPTRVTPTSSTLIDPIILSDTVEFDHSGCLDIDQTISDHRATCLFIKSNFPTHVSSSRKIWLYNQADFNHLNELLSSEDWSFIDTMSTNDACKEFTDKLLQHMNSCIPSKVITIRPNDKPWFDSEMRRYTKYRDRQRRIAINSKTQLQWNKYKHLRNKVNNLKKAAKSRFFDNIETKIEDYRLNNTKNYWKSINDLMKNYKSSESIPALKQSIDGVENLCFTDEEKANCLNDYFTSVSNIDDSNTHLPPFVNKTESTIEYIEIQELDVVDIISSLDANKAVGSDLISHKVLKNVKHTISKPLVKLFNKSLRGGIFPDLWKSAIVMPLFKKGDKHSPSNYRPISLLSCLGKLMERCVYKYIYNHLITNKLIHDKQSGFLTGHSTIYQLIDLYHQIAQSFDSKLHTCVVFCDISKAFDRVWHKGLLFKLSQLGIKGRILDWISNYLSNRSQRVFIGRSLSHPNMVTSGVPQGSVLGPLLFLVYVNDITENLLSIARLFADDTSLAATTSNIPDLEGILNHDLNEIDKWSKQWLVSFNPNKTEVLYFGNDNPPVLEFGNTILTTIDSHKHLGITLDDDCKWHSHINNIITSASKLIGIMRKLKFTVRRKTLNQIYISFLRPILEYGSVVWDNCSQYEKDRLEKIQLEAARIVTGTTRSISINNLYREIGWITLENRRKYLKMILTFKIKNSMVPDYLVDLFPRPVGNQYNLRNQNDFLTLPRRTALYERSFVLSASQLWNSLPSNLRNIQSLGLFKREILTSMFPSHVVPSYFGYGNRSLSIIHARLRNNCSHLRHDLFVNHVSNFNHCTLCLVPETAEHYFFRCRRYTNERILLFRETRALHPLNTNMLLFGRPDLSYEQNIIIVEAVHKFIKTTKRFSSTGPL